VRGITLPPYPRLGPKTDVRCKRSAIGPMHPSGESKLA